MSSYIITGANGDIGISIAHILKEYNASSFLVGTDASSLWPASGAGFDVVELIPLASAEGYLDVLRGLLKKYSAKYIIPTSEPELKWISEHTDLCTDIPFLMNDANLILTCMDKLHSIRWLEKIGIQVPFTQALKDAKVSDIPFIMKPRFGAGSRGIKCIQTFEDFSLYALAAYQSEMVAQQFLESDDKEYTCVIVKLESEFRTFIMHRTLKYGVTTEMSGLKNSEIENMLNAIAEHLPPFTDINVQLRLTPKGPRIFEINPRFSSTIKMRHMLGFSDFLWLLNGLEKGQSLPDTQPILGQKVYRVYQEIIGEPNVS